MTRRRTIAAVLAAAAIVALPATSSAQEKVPQTIYQLRARVRPRPGTDLSQLRTLPDAMSLARRGACGVARNLLGDGVPGRTEVQMVLTRQEGPTDALGADPKGVRCDRLERVSAFTLRARVVHPPQAGRYERTARMSLDRALRLTARLATQYVPRVIDGGEEIWLTLKVRRREKSVRSMIVSLARRYHVDPGTALRVAMCESGLNPRARSAAYGGIFQQAFTYWPSRARTYGHPGASIFDAYANIDVSLRMARTVGWGHWGCA